LSLLKFTITTFAVAFYCVVSCGSASADDQGSAKNRPLVIGYSSQTFYNVDPRDAIGLTKVWVQNADRAMKNDVPSNVVFFNDSDDMEKALQANEVDLVVLIAQEFTQLRERVPLRPVLSADYGRHFYDELLLLVRNDSGISRLSQLRGKTIRVESGQKGSIPILWLDSHLMAQVASDSHSFFSDITEYPKASQVIMPLFFKQSDACLASRDSLLTMSEMNPQIGRTLRILETSPGFVTGLLAVRSDIRNPRRDALVKAFLEIQNDPKGRQLLTIFRINRLVEFKPEHLAAIEKVLKEHRNSLASSKRRKR
jgi:ABC-type phosphate/phosphonate transport system substrate-binding protein